MASLRVPHSLSPAQSAPQVLLVFGSQNPHDVTESAHVAVLVVFYTSGERLEPM